MNNVTQWLTRKEPLLFIVFSILNVYEIFLVDFFHTLDGPQHLFVANILKELVLGNQHISNYVQVNDLIVGYWTGTFLLTFFKLFLPAKWALKCLLAVYFIGLPLSFRYLVKAVNKKPTFITFLIFPFSAILFIGWGYFNFSLSLIVMFISIGYYIRNYNILSWKKSIVASLLFILLFLTHALIYAMTGLILVMFFIYLFFYDWNFNRIAVKALKSFMKNVGILFLVTIPSNLLWLNYTLSIRDVTSYMTPIRLSFNQLVESIFDIKILIWFHRDQESNLYHYVFAILVFLILFAAVRWFMKKSPGKNGVYKFVPKTFWMVITCFIFLVYFIYPDRLVTGNVSMRILVVAFMMLLVCLSIQHYPKWVSVSILLVIIPITIIQREYHMRYLPDFDRRINTILNVASQMEENSTFLALNLSGNWVHHHFTSLPGIDKPMISANTPQIAGQFPLKINKEKCPPLYVGSKSCIGSGIYWTLIGHDTIPIRPIDYVLVIYSDLIDEHPEMEVVLQEVDKYYMKIEDTCSNRVFLYELKNRHQLYELHDEFLDAADDIIVNSERSVKYIYQELYLKALEQVNKNDTIIKYE